MIRMKQFSAGKTWMMYIINDDLSDDEDIPNAQPFGTGGSSRRWTTYCKQVSTGKKVKCAIL